MNEQDLMKKLALSKAIMDKSDSIKSPSQGGLPQNMVEQFDVPQARYNIPQDILESSQNNQTYSNPTKPVSVPTIDAIKNSKLPDEIKRLMIEHPINQPQQYTPTLSNDLIEKASRLMKNGTDNPTQKTTKTSEANSKNNFDYNTLKEMVKEAVNDVLKENGLLTESNQKTNEVFNFRVGKHIFEGKVTKIKKLS